MKNHILFIMGVSGTGKTTIGKLLSNHLNIPFYDGDDYHPQNNIDKMALGQALNDKDRKGWLERLNALAIEHQKQGAIIACSALKESYRGLLLNHIAAHAHFIYLQGTFEQVKQRLEARKGHFMPSTLLQSQFDTLEEPTNAICVSIAHEPRIILKKILKDLQSLSS